ncbi:hypothetical protein, partial [Helicobacter ganmani]|uniref:hypothetical protein n=1 Tax=Helicobacter ganmani TaxID=60246 RepID=UPI003A85F28A
CNKHREIPHSKKIYLFISHLRISPIYLYSTDCLVFFVVVTLYKKNITSLTPTLFQNDTGFHIFSLYIELNRIFMDFRPVR